MPMSTMTVNRLVHLQRLCLFKSQVPLASFFQGLYRAHGRAGCQNEIHMDTSGMASKRNSLPGIRNLCAGKDLSIKKCVPCNAKDLEPMTEQAAHSLISQVSEWDLVNEDGKLKLCRSMKVKSFLKGLGLFKLLADVAEAEGHHPDLHLVGWNNVTIEIWTHAVGGLTENDFILAAKINKIDMQHLLRRKTAD